MCVCLCASVRVCLRICVCVCKCLSTPASAPFCSLLWCLCEQEHERNTCMIHLTTDRKLDDVVIREYGMDKDRSLKRDAEVYCHHSNHSACHSCVVIHWAFYESFQFHSQRASPGNGDGVVRCGYKMKMIKQMKHIKTTSKKCIPWNQHSLTKWRQSQRLMGSRNRSS